VPEANQSRWSDGRRSAFSILLLLLITVLYSYPVPFYLSDKLIGGGADAWQFPWNNYTFRQQVTAGKNPYYTDIIFAPVGTSLSLHSYTEFNSAVGLLLSPFLNDVAQTNLMILLSTFLTATGTFLLVRHITKSSIAGLFSAIAFTFCPFRLVRMGGHVNFALTQWLPLAIWSFLRLMESSRWRYAIALGFFFALAHYSNQYYSVYLILILAVLFVTGLFLIPEWRQWITVHKVLISFFVALICLSPLLLRYFHDFKEGDLRSRERFELAKETAVSPDDYVHPNVMNHWIAKMLPRAAVTGADKKLSPGLITLFTGLAGLVLALRNKARLLLGFFLMGFLFLLLSFGPTMQVGATEIFLPYALLLKIPLINHVRIPTRFTIVVTLSLSILAGYAVSILVRNRFQWVRRFAVPLMFCLLLFELLPVPVHMGRFETSSAFREIGKTPGSLLLNLPFRFDALASRQMRHQPIHRQKIFDGRISRRPYRQVRYISELPVARSFVRITNLKGIPDSLIERDKNLSQAFRSFFDLRYVALFPDYSQIPGIENTVLELFPDARLLSKDNQIFVYELPELRRNEYDLRGHNQEFLFFLYSNWKFEEINSKRMFASTEGSAEFVMPALRPGQKIEIEAQFITKPESLRLTLLCDQIILGQVQTQQERKELRASVTASQLEQAHQKLELRFDTPGVIALQRLNVKIR
jgi:hypothetical protein